MYNPFVGGGLEETFLLKVILTCQGPGWMLGPQITVLHRRQIRITSHGAGCAWHRGGTEGDQIVHIPPEGITHNRRDGQVGAGAQQIPEAVTWMEDRKSCLL